MKKLATILIVLALVAAAAAAAGYYALQLPYNRARSKMPGEGQLTMRQESSGAFALTWPESEDTEYYLVEVLRPADGGAEAQALYSEYVRGAVCKLDGLPSDEELLVRIRSAVAFSSPGRVNVRLSDNALEAQCRFAVPRVSGLTVTPDPDGKTVALKWDKNEGDICDLYLLAADGTRQLVRTLAGTETVLHFGEGKDFALPEYGTEDIFVFDTYRETDDIFFYGEMSDSFSVDRNMLLGTVLNLRTEDLGNNVFSFSWDETKADHYEIQQYADGDWQTLETYSHGDTLTYITAHQPIFSERSFRVIAEGCETAEDGTPIVKPEESTVTTGACSVYTTVWPLKELEVYGDPDRSEVIGKVKAASAFCVLDEQKGMFLIHSGDGFGYIDSNFCLINLPEYIGDLCLYDITNSYSAKYMVHEYEIPLVTDTIVEGYDQVQMDSEEFLVPLLYPTAKKLIPAAQAALKSGYQLKIYDAFRPNSATRSIYNLTLSIIDLPLPEETFSGEPLENLPEAGEDEVLTYRNLVTNEKYDLSYFLATSGSNHNLGIALDLTMVDSKSGEELEMQTAMHDLSWYSVIANNNEDANRLASIMYGAGFGGLTSEWWHFQDNDIKKELGLNTYMWSGVSPACWVADDNGWRYRSGDGIYFRSCTATIAGNTCVFDSEGYLIG